MRRRPGVGGSICWPGERASCPCSCRVASPIGQSSAQPWHPLTQSLPFCKFPPCPVEMPTAVAHVVPPPAWAGLVPPLFPPAGAFHLPPSGPSLGVWSRAVLRQDKGVGPDQGRRSPALPLTHYKQPASGLHTLPAAPSKQRQGHICFQVSSRPPPSGCCP